MIEENLKINAEAEKTLSIEDLFSGLTELEPLPIANFVPINAAEQKKAFIDGTIDIPDHIYDKPNMIDFELKRQKINATGNIIVSHPDVQQKYRNVYAQFIQNYLDKTNFIEASTKVKSAQTVKEKSDAKLNFMELNEKLYGVPDIFTYQSLIGEKISTISKNQYSENGLKIRSELFDLINEGSFEKKDRFQPSQATVDWLHDIVDSENSLYGSMLEHVPEQDSFNDLEIKTVFESILIDEFDLRLVSNPAEAGLLWQIVIQDAQSVNVKAAEKKIVIPIGRTVNYQQLRKLVVHEIGVHFLRSNMGAQTDLSPLEWGLNDYYDTEEGLGAVMEQGLLGKYREAGADHYITAGLAYFDGKNFRDIFETKWRIALLTSNSDPSDDDISKAKNTAYNATMRIMRGTDELPWFKDLSYYNGAIKVWERLESIRGDETEFMLLLLGKADSGNPDHRRILLETATK